MFQDSPRVQDRAQKLEEKGWGGQGTNDTGDQCTQHTGNSELPEKAECPESEAVNVEQPPRNGKAGLEQGTERWGPAGMRGQSCSGCRRKSLATAGRSAEQRAFCFHPGNQDDGRDIEEWAGARVWEPLGARGTTCGLAFGTSGQLRAAEQVWPQTYLKPVYFSACPPLCTPFLTASFPGPSGAAARKNSSLYSVCVRYKIRIQTE